MMAVLVCKILVRRIFKTGKLGGIGIRITLLKIWKNTHMFVLEGYH